MVLITSKKPIEIYDSRIDTYTHITHVRKLLDDAIINLLIRATKHDDSKLVEPERSAFDIYTPKLQECTYGSNEYRKYLKEMSLSVEHHYKENNHHPEHFKNGISDMSLLDLLEMICDWGAAVKRHKNGDLRRSIHMNQERFGYSDELLSILENTAVELELIS